MSRALPALLVIAVALASSCTAKIQGVSVLPSMAPPFYSSSNGGALLAFFQLDGTTTIVDSSRRSNYTVVIDKSHQGSAYTILGSTSNVVRLLTVSGSQAFQLNCRASTATCEAALPVVQVPVNDGREIRAIERVTGYNGLYLMASVDTLILFSATSMRVVASVQWSSKTWMSQYGMDHVVIRQSYDQMNAVVQVYVVLANEASNFQLPGMVLSFNLNPQLSTNPLKLFTTTLTDTSPTNMQLTDDRGIFYWTQSNVTSGQAFILSRGGVASPPAVLSLKGNVTLSPSCFAEYPMLQLGMLSASSPSAGQITVGLKLGYGFTMPEVYITSVQPVQPYYGSLQFTQQPNKMDPTLVGIVELPVGYGIEYYNFADLPVQALTTKESSKVQLDKPLDSFARHKATLTSRFAPNCTPSNCGFDAAADCPQDHCWMFGSVNQALCCRRPPV